VKKKQHSNALRSVRKFFPKVEKVVDADEQILFHVTKRDAKEGARKDHANCAGARALVREQHADGAVVGKSVTFVVHENVATRYLTPVSVSREVVSNDRASEFEPGEYHLSPPTPTARLGHLRERDPHRKQHGKTQRNSRHIHLTDNVRTSLGARN